MGRLNAFAAFLAVLVAAGCEKDSRSLAGPAESTGDAATASSPSALLSPTDLGSFGHGGNANGINDVGQVVGWSSDLNSVTRAFSWDVSNGMIDIGTLGGRTATAFAVNGSGQVVGSSEIAALGRIHAFLWSVTGGMVDLGTLAGHNYSTAHDLNAGGQVVGSSGISQGNNSGNRAFLWNPTTGMRGLGTLPGGKKSDGAAINSSGWVVGTSATSGKLKPRAFLWRQGMGMTNLGVLPGGNASHALDINDAGQIVGYSTIAGGAEHAFVWKSGTGFRDLGTLGGRGSRAFGINSGGQVVGVSDTGVLDSHGLAITHAFLWDPTNGMTDLGDLGNFHHRSSAAALNTSGQIVGWSDVPSGYLDPILWQ